MADIDKLRAKAEGVVVPGPWTVWHDLDHQGFKTVGDAESYRELLDAGETDECEPVAHVYTDEDAEFIAAANPAVVLELLARIEAQDKAIREALALAERHAEIEARNQAVPITNISDLRREPDSSEYRRILSSVLEQTPEQPDNLANITLTPVVHSERRLRGRIVRDAEQTPEGTKTGD